MAKKFVRNITGTKIKGIKLEPLHTNTQNDIISDNEDIAIRNNNEYHYLTDNLKTEKLETGEYLTLNNKSKNGIKINGKRTIKEDSEKGKDIDSIMNPLNVKNAIDYQVPSLVKKHETEVKINSSNELISITKNSKNDFTLDLYELKEVFLFISQEIDNINRRLEKIDPTINE